MNSVTLTFAANGQQLVRTGCEKFAANTVNYIQAKFNLGEGWDGFDSIRAVWQTDFAKIATVLDNDGNCTVPQEVLKRVNPIMVNLVGSISDGTELTDRLTTYKIKALDVNGATNIDGTETTEITPSQFEQFVAIVRDEVAEVKDIDRVELNPDYTLTIYFSDGTSTTTGSIRGEAGPAGPEGPAGETGNGIESIDLTGSSGNIDTYTISFTDGSTTTFTVTNGEVTMEQLSQVLPTDTASGDIASFPDGSDLFDYLSCIVNLDPIQDLNGYDAPWVGGAGKNKLPYPFVRASTTASGITFTDNGDGTLTINGTATASAFYDCGNATHTFKLKSGTYTFNGSGKAGVGCTLCKVVDGSGSFFKNANTGNVTFTIEEDGDFYFYIVVNNGVTVNNLNVKLQLEEGSTASAWTPYENICPISGWDSVETVVSGVNVWDEETESGYINNSTGENVSSASQIRGKNYIPVIPNTTYYFKSPNGVFAYFYDANKEYIGVHGSGTRITNNTITLGADVHYIRISMPSDYGTTYNNDISINYPSTDHDYHAYQGQTYQTTLPQTVYGGSLDVVSGVLTVDRAMVDLGTLVWTYSGGFFRATNLTNFKRPSNNSAVVNAISSAYSAISWNAIQRTSNGAFAVSAGSDNPIFCNTEYSDVASFKSAMSGVQLVYELANPQTYQLTPQQINTLLGQNNVWSEQGSVAVVYKADIQLWVEKKLA